MYRRITMRNHTRNTAHSDVSRGLRNAFQSRSVDSGYYIVQGEPHMEDYVPCLHPVDPQAALISTSLPTHGTVTFIDVTLAVHNRQHGGPEFSVGAAAILRAREKHDMYNRTFNFSSDAVRLEVFAVETSGATPVSPCSCYSNRSAQPWLTALQHSQNIICCCSNCTCEVCHHCERPPHAGYGPLSSLH